MATKIPDYIYVGNKEEAKKTLSELIPIPFIPTEKTVYAFLGVLVLVILLSFSTVSIGSLTSLESTSIIQVGYPYTFLSFSTDSSEIINFKNLFIDLLLYILIGYAIDILINLIKTVKLDDFLYLNYFYVVGKVANSMDKEENLTWAVLAAPVVGVAAGLLKAGNALAGSGERTDGRRGDE